MVLEDAPPVTFQADIWALGCLLVGLMSGTVWPVGLSAAKIFGRIYNKQGPDVSKDIPTELADILKRCFHADPKQCPSAADVQKVDLHCKAEGTIVKAV